MELEKDVVVSYFIGFETHYENYGVNKSQWPLKLVPLLSPSALDVYSTLNATDRKDYDKVKKALFRHFQVSRATYGRKIDELARKSGERWSGCARRHFNLIKRWGEGCKSADDVFNRIVSDKLLKIMPRTISSKVKERRPDTLEDTAQWADDSWESLGWNYDILPNGDVRAQDKPYSSNHSHRVSSPESLHCHEYDRGATERTCKNCTTVETDDFHKDKDHKKGVRRCYICQKTGHYKADCHNGEPPACLSTTLWRKSI